MTPLRPFLLSLALLLGIAASASGCGDSQQAEKTDAGLKPEMDAETPTPRTDGGSPEAGPRPQPDAAMAPPDANLLEPRCCVDKECTKPDPDACGKGEACAIEPDGTPGTCTSECPKAQRCDGLCCPYGAACNEGRCELGDLAAERDTSTWPYPSSIKVNKNDCRIKDGCLPKAGRYTLLETTVRVKNVGTLPYQMIVGDDAIDKRTAVSFCQESYLLKGFVDVKLKDATGKVVREDQPPTLCKKAGKGGDYVCAVNGLEGGDTVDLPAGQCNQLDITELAAGDYTVEVTVNPKRTLAEKTFDNNTVSWTFTHSGCDGFVCGGVCCDPGVLCVDEVCGEPPPPDGGVWPPDGDGGIVGPPLITGNDTCETAYEISEQGSLASAVAAASGAESCDAEGGSAFFKISLEHKEVISVHAFDSQRPTSLSIYKSDCSTAPFICSADGCGGYDSGHFAGELEAGKYIIEARTKRADRANTVRLQLARTGDIPVTLIDHAGLYVGDTSKSVPTAAGYCSYDSWGAPVPPPDVGPLDGGVASGDGGQIPDGYSFNGPNDVYVFAGCDTSISVSTCGTSMFDSAIGVFSNGLGSITQDCSQLYDYGCRSDPNGAAMGAYPWGGGLTYIVVGGQTPEASGEYQLYVAY